MTTVEAPATLVPPPSVLPDVLPTERLNARGKATRELRDDLRRISNGRNAVAVASTRVGINMDAAD